MFNISILASFFTLGPSSNYVVKYTSLIATFCFYQQIPFLHTYRTRKMQIDANLILYVLSWENFPKFMKIFRNVYKGFGNYKQKSWMVWETPFQMIDGEKMTQAAAHYCNTSSILIYDCDIACMHRRTRVCITMARSCFYHFYQSLHPAVTSIGKMK